MCLCVQGVPFQIDVCLVKVVVMTYFQTIKCRCLVAASFIHLKWGFMSVQFHAFSHRGAFLKTVFVLFFFFLEIIIEEQKK